MHFRVLNTYGNIAHFISPTTSMKQRYSPFHLIGSKAVIDTCVHNTQNVEIFFHNKRNEVQPSVLFWQIFFTWQKNKNPEWLIQSIVVEKMFFNGRILYINSLRPCVCASVTELGSITDGRPGPARKKRDSEKKRDFGAKTGFGFRRTGPSPARHCDGGRHSSRSGPARQKRDSDPRS
jgi:hypothetical protein